MTPKALGTLAPGEAKTYELGVRLVATAEQAVAGTSVGVRFVWSSTEAVPVPTPVPIVPDVPVVPVVPPAPVAPPVPAPPAPAPTPPPPADVTPPTLVLGGATSQRPVRQKQRVRVSVRCDEPCLLRIAGRLSGKAKVRRDP